jgi:hypothetical protein
VAAFKRLHDRDLAEPVIPEPGRIGLKDAEG